MESERVHILLVDDDATYCHYVRYAFKRARVANPITVAQDGAEALAILRGGPDERGLPRPNIILLDLNMPGMDGHEFLQELREDDSLKDLLVFVITSSDYERDKEKAYGKNVAGYIVKDDPAGSLSKAIDMLQIYWNIVKFP